MEKIEQALKNGGNLKAVKKKLGTGNNQMYAIRDKEGNVIRNMDKIVEVAEQFYKDLYSSGERQNNNAGESPPDEFEIQQSIYKGNC